MPDNNFYKDKAWDLLLADIKNIKDSQVAMSRDIISIKEKMKWVFGFAAGVTFVINIGWMFFKEKVLRI